MGPSPAPGSAASKPAQPTLVRGLSLFDSVLLLMGGTIGSGIFLTPHEVALSTRTPGLFLLVWAAGFPISLLACFAFAELGGMFPHAGGQYIYLREIYGELVAFLYGWTLFAMGVSGSVAALAVGSAEYLGAVLPALEPSHVVFAAAGWRLNTGEVVAVALIALLSVINVLGVKRGALMQNAATGLSALAMGVFIVLGLTVGHGSRGNFSISSARGSPGSSLSTLGVALIAVLFTYDGWVNLTWASGEVKNPQRNLSRALLIGVSLVGLLYMLMNVAYLYALSLPEMAQHQAVAEAAAAKLFFPQAGRWIALVVALACLGSANSAALAGARVYYAMAADGLFYRRFAEVHPRWRTPAFSLMLQAIWASVLALSGSYDELITCVIFLMVAGYVASVVGVFILRRRRPDWPRPYRCTGYPWTPILYVIIASLWGLNAVWRRPKEAAVGLLLLLVGLPGYYYWRKRA